MNNMHVDWLRQVSKWNISPQQCCKKAADLGGGYEGKVGRYPWTQNEHRLMYLTLSQTVIPYYSRVRVRRRSVQFDYS